MCSQLSLQVFGVKDCIKDLLFKLLHPVLELADLPLLLPPVILLVLFDALPFLEFPLEPHDLLGQLPLPVRHHRQVSVLLSAFSFHSVQIFKEALDSILTLVQGVKLKSGITQLLVLQPQIPLSTVMLLLQRKMLDFQVFLCLLDVGGMCLKLFEVGTDLVDLAHQLQGLICAGI